MSYSRRQLYAMGEPLGDSATYRKADGGLVLGDGGGGGGGGGELAEKTVTNIMELPGWARQYAQDTLAKGSALTNIEKNPYQQYGGERTAGFTDLQQQSFQNAKNLGPNALSVQGGLNALNAGQNYANQATDPYAMSAYMSPYMNQVVANQMSAANRNYDISAAQQQAQATQAGAFGGGREAVMRAENERARNSALNSIQAQGLQSAFEKAQQAQQFGSTLGLQGAQAATQAGQNVFGQQQAAIGLENQLGGQQQALAQTELSNKYQDFLNRQNYPYQQLSFMSNLIRGTPIGQQSTNQIYQAAPSTAQNIASLGLGAAGIAALAKADGGMVHDYASGGEIKGYAGDEGSVVSDMHDVSAMSRDVASLSDAQLQEILRRPTTRAEAEAAQQEMAFRASMRGGLAGAVTPQMVEKMAGGGVVAFGSGGLNDYMNTLNTLGQQDTSMSDEERLKAVRASMPGIQEAFGTSKTAGYLEDIRKQRAEAKEAGSNEAMGMGLLQAARALSAGPNWRRQAGEALGAYGEAVSKIKKENREADRLLQQSEISLATADQARADGMVGKAFEWQKLGEEQKGKALDRKIGVAEKQAQIAGGLEQAKIQASATMAAASKATDLDKQANALYKAAIAKDPSITKDPVRDAQTMAAARGTAADQLGRYSGTARAEAAVDKAIAPDVQMALMKNKDYRAAEKASDFAEMARIRNNLVNSMKPVKGGEQPQQTPQPAPAQPTIKVGQVMQGYRFKGGNPADQANWEKV